MSKIKIGFDIRGIYDGFKGGVGEYSQAVLNGLCKQEKLEIEAFVSGLNTLNYSLDLPKNTTITKIKLPNKILNTSLILTNKPKLDSFLDKKPDLIFMPNINIGSFSDDLPLVLTVHDLSFLVYPEVFSKKMLLWHQMVQVRKLLNRANHIVAVSESTAQDIRDLFSISDEKISVIYPGVSSIYGNKELEAQNETLLKTKYNLPDRFLLYLGTIEPRKNIQLIINAFEQIASKYSDISLVIAGKQGWLAEETMQKVKDSPYRSRIHCIGYIETKDKSGLYKLAEIFIYPSFYEGFGFPPLEAMHVGTPTITSNSSSFPEVVGNGAWKVSPFDAIELASAIDNILTNRELRDELVKNGIHKAKKYSWNKTIHELELVFQNILSTKKDLTR